MPALKVGVCYDFRNPPDSGTGIGLCMPRSWSASVTSHVHFGTDICLMPFNHPVRLAEDLAVLDDIPGGRVELGVEMGYAPRSSAASASRYHAGSR